jgi:ABC-type glycerol-3-phosphate transport system permease component
MVDTAQRIPVKSRAASRWDNVRTSRQWQGGLRQMVSYLFLLLGAGFMLFPMLWMFSASLKPPWQIFTQPPIWIPQHWETVSAGNTNRPLLLYRVEHEGEVQNVIRIGARRYTTVIVPDQFARVQSVPTDQLGDAVPTTVGNVVLNVRSWTADGETRDVVALARGDGDTLIVATLEDLQPAILRLPLDEVNNGGRASLEVSGTAFRGRVVETESGVLSVIPIGPESDLAVVAPPDVAANARLVPLGTLSAAATAVIGETELPLSRIEGDDTDYVVLARDSWQPIINEDELDEHAFTAPSAQLGERTQREVNGITMQVTTFSPDDGSTPYDVIILVNGTSRSLVMPASAASTLRLSEFGALTTARGDTTERIPYRVQDGFSEGELTSSVALIGEPRNMALIVPVGAISDAFDVNPAQLERAMRPQLRFDGYRQALTTKVGETYFPTFFRNSFLLVALNTIGHVLSCVVVAYAFARLRAPGKNFLFLVLLGTMMLPFPVTIVPMYEIFRDLGMINTFFPLFIRSFFGNAFLIFMLRQFFASIPRELEEAARIDGANVLQIIWNIFVPLSKPAIATVVIFTFWWTWNSFLEPLIYLNSPELFPVSVGLNFFKDQYGTIFYDRLIAASVLSILPMLLLFFFAQRYFIEGIQLSGLKG